MSAGRPSEGFYLKYPAPPNTTIRHASFIIHSYPMRSFRQTAFMRRNYLLIAALVFSFTLCLNASQTLAQTQNPVPKPSPGTTSSAPRTAPPQQTTQPPPAARGFDLMEYGVQIQPEPRLIVMMAALDAAGFDPVPNGQELSVFRTQLRRDLADLDDDLRKRLRDFFERHKLKSQGPTQPTPAEQSARYLSLAYVLGPAPTFDAPARVDDLPAGVLEVMDFAPLLREFYRKSGIDARLPAYLQKHREEGERLRRPTAEMVRFVLSYLHTRPTTSTIERIPVKSPGADQQKKDAPPKFTVREHERRFVIVPDLLAAPAAVNLRVIADDYYLIVPEGTDPTASEIRRAYLQYVVDPIIARFNRDIAQRREQIKLLLDERTRAGATVSADVFRVVSRSLVTAAEVRLEEAISLAALTRETRARFDKTTDSAARAAMAKEQQAARAALEDESLAQLAEAYERGDVLAFYFAEQISGIETSGFDISSFFADMIASFDPARESRRLTEAAAARARAVSARKTRQDQRRAALESGDAEPSPGAEQRAALIKSLGDVEKMLQLKDYAAAEARLKLLLQQFQGEPRIFFALGQTSSLWARDTTDDDLQGARLNQALAHYRMAVQSSSADTDRALVCRAHEAQGRILAFLDRPADAVKEFDAVIGLGQVCGDVLRAATEGKTKLGQQQ